MSKSSVKPPQVYQIWRYSYHLDNRDGLKGLPTQSAYDLMVDSDTKALWKQVRDNEEIDNEDFVLANRVVEQYPEVNELEDVFEKQQFYASVLDCGVRFGAFDKSPAEKLISTVKDGEMLSEEEFGHLQYLIYRYRRQIRDKIIYEEDISDQLRTMLDDDPRQTLDEVLQDCKSEYEKRDTRYNAQD